MAKGMDKGRDKGKGKAPKLSMDEKRKLKRAKKNA